MTRRLVLVVATAATVVLVAIASAGCTRTVGEGHPDLDAARSFDGFPLYWVGERFEGWDLEHFDVGSNGLAVFSYGTCELELGADGGCPVPLQIQIQPLCAHLADVARAPIWKRREVRGAPVGTIDSAPVLFASRVQVRVYRGQGSDPGLPLRALRVLRSVNTAAPRIGPADPIPPAPRDILSGVTPCQT